MAWKMFAKLVFSERELVFTFAICCRPSVCLSVGNARVPYSGSCNFWQYFYGCWYPGIRWHPQNFFTEIVPGEPSVGGVKHEGRSNIAILDLPKAISWKRCKIGGKLVLITNRKSHMSFFIDMKIGDLERHNGPYFALFHRIHVWCCHKTFTSVSKSTVDSLWPY